MRKKYVYKLSLFMDSVDSFFLIKL